MHAAKEEFVKLLLYIPEEYSTNVAGFIRLCKYEFAKVLPMLV